MMRGMSDELRLAPAGFTATEWQQFMDQGYILKPGVLSEAECDELCQRLQHLAEQDPKYDPAQHYSKMNAAPLHPDLAAFINRDSHIGYIYDVYGELSKVHLSQFMLRPKGTWRNFWHPDGPRALPYQVFSNGLPLQIKVSYWLTEIEAENMGNLIILPGSHNQQYMDGYDTHETMPGELQVCAKRGTMMIMHASTWHRVAPNESEQVRKNIFFTYSPAWIVPEDRFENDEEWLNSLSREQRILMRSYPHYPYANCKPPAEDFPLFLDRETGTDRDDGVYREHVELHRRKRKTWVEKLSSGI